VLSLNVATTSLSVVRCVPSVAVGHDRPHLDRLTVDGRRVGVGNPTATTDDVFDCLSEVNVQQSIDDEVAREADRLQDVREFDSKQQRLVVERLSISVHARAHTHARGK